MSLTITNTISTDTTYAANNYIKVESGGTININAGVIISFAAGTGHILVESSGIIQIKGTPTSPVIITSNESIKVQSDWIGIIILTSVITLM